MRYHDARLEPELEALLAPRKVERQAPPEVRARAIARAQALVAAGGWAPARASERSAAPLRWGWGPFKVALLASVAVAAGAIGTVIAPGNRRADSAPREVPAQPSARARELPSAATGEPSATIADPPLLIPPPAVANQPRPSHAAAEGDPFAAELDLLSRAQAAYTRHDFSRALALVGEHTRRFPSGHLAEEREALRARSLVGSGRDEEGQRAAASFARRFPRSVLLPRVGESPSGK